MIKIGDKVVAHIFHMSAVGILMEIDGTEYRVRVGQHDYWVDRVTPHRWGLTTDKILV